MRNHFRSILVGCSAAFSLLVAQAPAVRAQDAASPTVVSPAPTEASPPLATQEVPAPVPAAPLPDTTTPNPPPLPTTIPAPATRPLTPPQLVDKSIRDLERGALGDVVKDDIKALRRGPLLIHGNYCGIGNRPGEPPIDALDTACMHHDACTGTGTLPSCACDQRLRVEATAVAEDPNAPPDLRITAAATAAAIAVLICTVPAPN